MSDITLCSGQRTGEKYPIPACPLRMSCARYKRGLTADEHASWFTEPPYRIHLRDSENTHGDCAFWMATLRPVKRRASHGS